MATHSRVLAWRIPGMAEPGGLPAVYGVAQSRTWLKRLSSLAAYFICISFFVFFVNLKSSFCSRIQSRTFHCTESLCFLRLLQTVSVSQTCFIFDDLLRSIGQVFGEMSFNLDLSDIFLMVRMGLCHYQCITTKEGTISMTYWRCKPGSSDWGCVWQVYPLMFISSLTFFFFLELFLLSGNS